jgi:hypothetical protein
MLIDDFLPTFDVCERHGTKINAQVESVYSAIRELDLSEAKLSGFLFRLRGMRAATSCNLAELLKLGFVLLDEKPNEELLLGLVGRFWTPSGGVIRLDPEGFRRFNQPGFAKAVWNFSLADQSPYTLLQTETRVLCTDDASRRRFRLYWTFVGHFSGLVRRNILRAIKKNVETASRLKARFPADDLR